MTSKLSQLLRRPRRGRDDATMAAYEPYGAPPAADDQGHLHALLKLSNEDDAPPPPPSRGEHPALSMMRRSPPTTPPQVRKSLQEATPSPPRVPRVRPGSTGSTTASSISDSVNSVSVSTPSIAERSMRKMISNLGPPRSIHMEDEDPTKPVKWRSLRSRGAKLYAWATAARLSAEGRGAGVNLGFDPASPVQSMKKMEKEASETSLELMRIKATRKQQLGEKAKRERALALEATTRMLDYLAAGGGEAQMGSRLSIDALREIGASDEISSEDRRRSRHHRRGSSAGSTISDADSYGESFASNSYSDRQAHPLFTRSAQKAPRDPDSSDDDGAGGALASHLATFKFRRALDAAAGSHKEQQDLKTVLGNSKAQPRLSGAAQRAAAAFAARGGGRKEPRAPPWSPFQEELAPQSIGLGLSDDEEPVKRAHRRQPSQEVPRLGAEAPRKARVELWPETEAVLRLHAAIARGDARAVRAAAVEGARGGPVGAFATMARALHVAAARDGAFGAPRAGVVELLVSLGADACAPDAIGATPLHVAAACGNASALAALLRSATCDNDDGDGAAEQAAARRCHAGLTPLEVSLTRRRDARELFASLLCRARAFDVDFTDGPLGIKLALVRHTIPRSAPAGGLFAPAPPSTRPPPPPPPPPLSSRRRRPSSEDGERPLVAMSQPPRRHRRTASDGAAPWQDDASRRAARHARRLRSLARERGAPVPPPIPELRRKSNGEAADDFCGPRAPPARTLLVSSVSDSSQARGLLEPGDQLLALNGLVLAPPDEAGFQALMGRIKTLSRPLRATFVAGSFPHLSVEDDPCIDLLTRFSPAPRPENQDDEPR